jgi:transposase
MRILKTLPHLTIEEIKKKLSKQNDFRKYQNWQIIFSVHSNPGKSAEEFASILGVNKHKVYRIIETYNKYGPDWDVHKQWGGRREERAYMTLEKEAEILKDVVDSAIKGQVITANDIRSIVEEKIGHSVSDDYLWDILNRHSWSKKAPRPTHPDKDTEAQEDFKKNSKKIWLPPL